MGIRPLHAVIDESEEGIFVEPVFTGEDSGCYLNGELILTKTELMHLDRLTFGTNNMFIVIIPDTKPRMGMNEELPVEEKNVDWEFAQNELYLKKEKIEQKQIEERERKIKEETEAMLKKKEEELASLQRVLEEEAQKRKDMEAQKEIEITEMEKKLREEEAEKLRKEIEAKK